MPVISDLGRSYEAIKYVEAPDADITGVAVDQINGWGCPTASMKSQPVEYRILDFRQLTAHKSVSCVLEGRKLPPARDFTDLDILHLLNDINKTYPLDVDHQLALRHITDFYYETTTKSFFYKQAALYFFLFLIPFLLQLFASGDTNKSRALIWTCVGILQFASCYLFFIEYQQIKSRGFKVYIADTYNKIDLTIFILISIYSILRVNDTGPILPNNQSSESIELTVMSSFNLIIITQVFFKIQFYMQADTKLNLLIHILKRCLIDIFPFCVFLALWLCLFALFNRIFDEK